MIIRPFAALPRSAHESRVRDAFAARPDRALHRGAGAIHSAGHGRRLGRGLRAGGRLSVYLGRARDDDAPRARCRRRCRSSISTTICPGSRATCSLFLKRRAMSSPAPIASRRTKRNTWASFATRADGRPIVRQDGTTRGNARPGRLPESHPRSDQPLHASLSRSLLRAALQSLGRSVQPRRPQGRVVGRGLRLLPQLVRRRAARSTSCPISTSRTTTATAPIPATSTNSCCASRSPNRRRLRHRMHRMAKERTFGYHPPKSRASSRSTATRARGCPKAGSTRRRASAGCRARRGR